MSNKNVQTVQDPYKAPEYQAFIKLVEKGQIPETWELMAEAIGVHRNTITQWKTLPEFKEATAKGIERSIKGMEESGAKDWRMWRERASILAREAQKGNINVQVNVMPILGGSTKDLSNE